MKALGRTRRAESKRSKSPGSFWTGYFLQSLNPPPFSSSTTCVVLHQNPNHSQCCLSGVLLLSQQPTHAAYYASRCLFLAVSPSLSLSRSLISSHALSISFALTLVQSQLRFWSEPLALLPGFCCLMGFVNLALQMLQHTHGHSQIDRRRTVKHVSTNVGFRRCFMHTHTCR